MRRSFKALSIIVAVAGVTGLAGCEDGPSQTFSVAPAGAGQLWNNGNTPAAVTDASASFLTNYGGTSKTEICSGAELQSQWARMVAQPIAPPYFMAGVNIAGINYQSLTVDQAENGIVGDGGATGLFPAPGATNPPTRLCQGQNLGQGSDSGDVAGGTLLTAWGQNQEFTMEWAVNTHKDYYNQINPGYSGAMTWTYKEPAATAACSATQGCDGMMHTFEWALGRPITIDGQVFTLDWDGYATPSDQFFYEADVLYRGLTSYFTPDLYDNLPPGSLCRDTGRCPVFPTGNDYVHPIIGFRTISMYWDMDPPVLPQPSGSTPHDAYFFNIKYAPYSPAISILDMSTAAGPTGSLNPIGDMTPPMNCALSLGGTYGALSTNCINVFQAAATNTLATEKVLGNLTHSDQDFVFSVVGINQNYRPPQLDIGGSRQFDVIHDNELPAADAIAVDFTLDVRANGPILNDRYPTPTNGVYGRDNHGAGAVWREFGRLVQQDLANKYAAANGTTAKTLHDPTCLFPAAGFPPGQGPANFKAPAGCTGFEAWIDEAYPNVLATTGLPVDPEDPTQTDPNNVWDIGFTFGDISDNGLRPGTPYGLFCMDPGTYDFCGAPSLYGQDNDLLDAALAQVTQIMGNGNPNSLPVGTGDRRYFLSFFTQALAKYFISGAATHTGECGGPAATLPGYCSPAPATTTTFDPVPYFGDTVLNTDDFFFDSFGGNANRGEFIQYDFADPTHDPTDFQISMLLIGSNLQEEHFFRRLDREERALFEALGSADSKQDKEAAWALDRDTAGKIHSDEWGHPVKNADVFITNIAGSPAIAAGPWSAPADMMGNPIPIGACATAADCSATEACTGGFCVGACKAGTACTTSATCAVGQTCTLGICAGAATTPECANGQDCLSGACTAVDPCFPLTPPAMVMKSAYYCATHIDADCAYTAPLNPDGSIISRANGAPLLSGYCGIWNPTQFALGSMNMQFTSADISPVNQQYEEEAEMIIPNLANPYDPTTAVTNINVLVPWLPVEEGVGFAVPSTGQTNVFVQTGQLDFSGQVIVPVIDYLPYTIGPATSDGGSPTVNGPLTACPSPLPAGTTCNAQIQAIESGDFLGDVFLCYDTVTQANRAGTGQPGDVLNAHMYTSAQEILNWIADHPQAQANCNLIVRYSPFDNYPDYITSLANGVTVDIDQGEGLGRVVDLTLFVPGSGAPAQP